MTALIRSSPAPELAAAAMRIRVDCDHALTELVLIPPRELDPAAAERSLVGAAIAYHEAAERCGCAIALGGKTGGRA